MIGRQIGSWILERELDHGGMGTVYLARHAKLGTPAAVKALSPALGAAAEFRERFEREAAVHARLRHPHIASMLDYLEADDRWFLVIEYLPGGNLADRLRDGTPPSPAQAVGWVRQALAGLGHAHAQGVVHRDVKPANLMLDEHGAVKVSDFGIARPAAGSQLTSTGASLGTLQYMSPEQLDTPNRVDHRTDLYSMGVVLYQMLAGRVPFDGETPSQIFRAHLTDTPPPPLRALRPGLDPQLEQAVLRALARDPERRFQSAEEMREALAPFEIDRPTATAPRPAAGTVLWSTPEPVVTQLPQGPSRNPLRARRTILAAAALVIALGLAALAAVVLSQGEADPVEPPSGPNLADSTFPELEPLTPPAVSEEALRTSAQEATSRADEASDAARQARAALDRVKRAADEAKDGLTRVLRSLGDFEVASAAARDAQRAASLAVREARAVSSHAETARHAADAAASALDQLAHPHVARAHPLQGLFLLAAAVPQPGADGSEFADTARKAAERARQAALSATKSEQEAKLYSDIAERSSDEAASALERVPRLPDQVIPRPPGQSLPPSVLPSAPLPDQPVVAVLAPGDPVFGGPLEEVLGRRLRRAGFKVRDARGVPAVDRLLRKQGADADPERLAKLLVEDGFHVLVLAPVEIAERKEVKLRGLEGSISLGQARLNAYLLPADQHLGRGWRDRIEYTELNAEVKAEQALIGATREMVGDIREGWSGFRQRVAQMRSGR